MKEIPKYFVDSFDSKITAVSLVDAPAIEADFHYFSSAKKVMLADEEQRIVVGPVLRPNYPIYRRDEATGFEFMIEFSERAVKELAYKYLRDGFGNSWSVDHERPVEGLSVVESWIKMSNQDKSVAMGVDPSMEKGTWFIVLKVDSDEIWQEIRDNRWRGFSIESWLSLYEEELFSEQKKINNEEMNENKKQNFLEKVKSIFEEVFGAEEAQNYEVEVEMEHEAEEAEDSVIEPVIVVEPEEAEEEQPEEEEPEQAVEQLSAIATLEDENTQLKNQVEQLLAKVKELSETNEKLSKQPSAKPVEVKGGKQDSASDRMDIIRQLHEGTYFNK